MKIEDDEDAVLEEDELDELLLLLELDRGTLQ